jgi:hypothetical protein
LSQGILSLTAALAQEIYWHLQRFAGAAIEITDGLQSRDKPLCHNI